MTAPSDLSLTDLAEMARAAQEGGVPNRLDHPCPDCGIVQEDATHDGPEDCIRALQISCADWRRVAEEYQREAAGAPTPPTPPCPECDHPHQAGVACRGLVEWKGAHADCRCTVGAPPTPSGIGRLLDELHDATENYAMSMDRAAADPRGKAKLDRMAAARAAVEEYVSRIVEARDEQARLVARLREAVERVVKERDAFAVKGQAWAAELFDARATVATLEAQLHEFVGQEEAWQAEGGSETHNELRARVEALTESLRQIGERSSYGIDPRDAFEEAMERARAALSPTGDQNG